MIKDLYFIQILAKNRYSQTIAYRIIPNLSNAGSMDNDNKKIKGIILAFLSERRNQGRTTRPN